jgi:predicted Zn-dependent protease with MMP-like domain
MMEEDAMKISRRRFDEIVRRALERIPEEFRTHLDNMIITIQSRPSPDLLEEMGYGPDDELLGVYTGVPLTERSTFDPPLYPDVIYLFQEPLQEMCAGLDELEREIEITVVHEIAHYLGIDEQRLAELGYG